MPRIIVKALRKRNETGEESVRVILRCDKPDGGRARHSSRMASRRLVTNPREYCGLVPISE